MDRKRLRSNMELVTRFDPDRPDPEDEGYVSSDIERDYEEQMPTRRKVDNGAGRQRPLRNCAPAAK